MEFTPDKLETTLMSPTTEDGAIEDRKYTQMCIRDRHIAVGMCYCRHKMQHMGMACDAPMDICMTFGNTANSLIPVSYTHLDVYKRQQFMQL